MTRHTIKLDEMYEYLGQETWQNAAYSCSKTSQKRLEISTKGMFRVTDHDKVTYQGASLGVAVDAYNEAP